MLNILDIPIEILFHLFSLISDYKSFFALSLTCKTFSIIALDINIQQQIKAKSTHTKELAYETKVSRYREVFQVLPNGKKHGEFKKFFGNGKILEHQYFNENKVTGEYKVYHYNGNLKIHCYYKDNKLHGNYKEYDNNNNLLRNEIYHQGQISTKLE